MVTRMINKTMKDASVFGIFGKSAEGIWWQVKALKERESPILYAARGQAQV